MKISVFGLGYVGCVSAACLAKLGHDVTGIDISDQKVDLLNSGQPTIVETGLGDVVAEQVAVGRLKAERTAKIGMPGSEMSLVCVGTPSKSDGLADLTAIEAVCEQISDELSHFMIFHVIAIRSTVPPGTCQRLEALIEARSKKKAGHEFSVVSNPEFLREGSSVSDYFNPPFTLVGADCPDAISVLERAYQGLQAPFVVAARPEAEFIKYANNSFHALKIVFANEIARICKPLGVDATHLMALFCRDDKLNISSAYLKPGFAYGGSCLPKDLRALTALARQVGVHVPVLQAIEPSNQLQIQTALDTVVAIGNKRIGVLGLAFKAGTDDLRESPVVELLERLIGKGFDLVIYDPIVVISNLVGGNKQFVDSRFPHLTRLLVTNLNEISDCETIIVTQNTVQYQEFVKQSLENGRDIVDLVRIFDRVSEEPHYHGIGW